MRGRRPRPGLTVALVLATSAVLAPRAARAQISLEGEGEEVHHPYHSPQRFAFELRFGPYRPDVDSEFTTRQPYQEFFGSGSKLLTQAEMDIELFHRFGTAAIGVGLGYFQVSGPAPLADGTGNLSGDKSTLKVVPLSLSAVYRFDYLLENRGFPLVPYGKLGLDYAYWQITDGNDRIAKDGFGGQARGATPGWHVALGLALVLDIFDPEAARDFDSDLGVNHTALIFEYGHSDISGFGSNDALHVGDTTWSLGVLMQF